MCSPPLGIKYFYLFVAESIRLKFPPCIDTAHVAEGEIAGLPHTPLWTVLRVGAGRNTEDAACGLAIRFITRVVCCIKTPICVELPFFAGYPCQNPALNRAEVGADQCVTGRGTNHCTRAVTHNGERLGI